MPNETHNQNVVAPKVSLWRRGMDHLATIAAITAVILVLAPLAAVFGYLVYKGFGSINLAFLTKTPKPPGEVGGGMANAIAGSSLILMLGSIVGVPVGIGAGIYLAEYGQKAWLCLRKGISARWLAARP
ncbi:MAG: hypothetical protein ABSE92_17265 [Terriglobales bacterium]